MLGGLKISQEEKNGLLILHLEGRLDPVTAPTAEEQLLNLVSNGISQVILDCSKTDYVGSAGIRFLFAVSNSLRNIGGKLVLCSVNPRAMHVLKMSEFDKVLEIVTNVDEAVKRF